MKIEIQGKGVEIDKSVRRFVSHRVDFALSLRADYIDSVLVLLADTGTPDDLGETSCLVQVKLHGITDILVENTDANLYVAVHRAVDRAGWTVSRAVMRQRRQAIASLLGEPYPAERRVAVRAA